MKQVCLGLLLFVTTYAGELFVTVDDIIVDSGTVYIGVYDNEAKFTRLGKEVKKVVVPAGKEKISGTFRNLPLGVSYAVFSFQDMNNNGKLDFDKLGKPEEPVAFSNQTKKGFQNYLRSAFIMRDSVSIELMLHIKK